MKTTLLLILMAMMSCAPPRSGNTDTRVNRGNKLVLDSVASNYDCAYRVFTLDSCEYIVVGYGDMKWGSHKGDCRNPIHRQMR